MKSVKYETSPGALAAFLASRPQAGAYFDLYRIDFVGNINGGLPLLFTTADIDILVPYTPTALTYSSRLIYFDQLKNKSYGHWKIGLDVDTWQVITSPTPQASIGDVGWVDAIRGGALDGAVVTVDRAFFDTRASGLPQGVFQMSPLGVINVFTGRVAEVDFGRTNVVISINSHLELLNAAYPRNAFQAPCRWTLFDAGCTLTAATFAKTGAASVDTDNALLATNLPAPSGSGTYALGRVVMTSGLNEGFSRAVRAYTAGTPALLTLIAPFPFPVLAGDTLAAYPGCDKTEATCTLFANLLNFGGQEFIPAPEVAV